jgi:hypothetical protein
MVCGTVVALLAGSLPSACLASVRAYWIATCLFKISSSGSLPSEIPYFSPIELLSYAGFFVAGALVESPCVCGVPY